MLITRQRTDKSMSVVFWNHLDPGSFIMVRSDHFQSVCIKLHDISSGPVSVVESMKHSPVNWEVGGSRPPRDKRFVFAMGEKEPRMFSW